MCDFELEKCDRNAFSKRCCPAQVYLTVLLFGHERQRRNKGHPWSFFVLTWLILFFFFFFFFFDGRSRDLGGTLIELSRTIYSLGQRRGEKKNWKSCLVNIVIYTGPHTQNVPFNKTTHNCELQGDTANRGTAWREEAGREDGDEEREEKGRRWEEGKGASRGGTACQAL